MATDTDQNVFILTNNQLFIAINVDDLLLFGVDKAQISVLKQELSSRFQITDLGDVFHYLGMEVC